MNRHLPRFYPESTVRIKIFQTPKFFKKKQVSFNVIISYFSRKLILNKSDCKQPSFHLNIALSTLSEYFGNILAFALTSWVFPYQKAKNSGSH